VKTISLKKVAAVAVASLGFGLLSVVPANAALAVWTFTKGTATPTTPIVGTAVTIPLTAAMAANDTAATTMTVTATFDSVPANSALTAAANLAASTASTSALWTAGTGPVAVTAAANVLTAVAPNPGAAVAASTLGSWIFTPDVAGIYSVTLTGAAGTGTPTFTTNVGTQNAKVAAIIITVGGASLTQAASGKGAVSGTAVAGGSAVASFTPAAATAANTIYNIVSSGVGTVSNPLGCASLSVAVTAAAPRCSGTTAVGQAAVSMNGVNFADGIRYTSPTAVVTNDALTGDSATGQMTFDAASSTVGTQTITITKINLTTGVPSAAATITIVWTATASGASTGYSTVFIGAGSTCATVDALPAVTAASTSVTTISANICITLKDASNVALVGQPITATVEGPGLVLGAAGTATGTAGVVRVVSLTAATMAADNTAKINITADGTSGTTTIKVYQGTTLLATKTMYFYGTVATLTATQNLKVARASATGATLGTSDGTGLASAAITAALTPAVVIVAKDAAGVVVPGLTITGLSSDVTVISSSTVAQAVGTTSTTGAAGPGTYLASVTSAVSGTSGKSATVTFRTLKSDGTYISAAPVTFTLGGSLATGTETISFDKTSYAPGEAMTVTVTAKDSAGNPVFDGSTSPTLTASKSVGGSLPSGFYTSGTVKNTANTLFAPALGGSFSVNATSGNTAETKITASSSVTDANAGLLTQIDALNAKIVALNALIAKIMKKLGVK